jgi:hypothetical protein
MDVMKLKKILTSLLGFFILISPLFALAQSPGGGSTPPPPAGPGGGSTPPPTVTTITIENPLKGSSTLYGFISDIINNIVLPLGGVIAVLYIMYAGFLLVTARGDEKQIGEGKAAFTNAAIGTAILLGAWVIAQVIETTINQLRA